MLLEHEEAYQVVRSTQVGLMQHDGFSWQVKGERFEHLTELAEGGKIMDQTLRSFLRELTEPQRVQFVDTLFAILTCTDASTLTDLKEGGLKTASAMVKALQKLDKPTRKALTDTLKLLVKSGARSAFEELGISRLRDNRLIRGHFRLPRNTQPRVTINSHTKDKPPMTLHDYLFTLLLAMAPVSELRGAIPFGLAHDIPQALPVSPASWQIYCRFHS